MQDGRVYMRKRTDSRGQQPEQLGVLSRTNTSRARGAAPVTVRTRLVPLRTSLGREARPSAGAQRNEKTPLTQGLFSTRLLWAMVDSNHRPPPYQRGALTD